jgi:hypothetical protein
MAYIFSKALGSLLENIARALADISQNQSGTMTGPITLQNGAKIDEAVDGEVTVDENLTVAKTFDATGATALASTLSVGDDITLENGAKVSNTAADTLEFTETNIKVSGTFETTGASTLGGDVTFENGEKIKNDVDGRMDVVGNSAVIAGTTGGLTIVKTSEATATLTGATTDIDVDVPAGVVLLGTQLRVDTEITSGDGATSWAALYKTGATQAITTAQAFTKNTKVNKFFDANAATAITSGVTKITINPDSNTFSGGVIRAIVYYQEFIAMGDAA